MADTLELIIKAKDEASQQLKKISGIVKTLGAVFGGIAILDFAKDTMKAGIAFEQTQVAFSSMLGSAEKANKLLGDLAKTASTTPFELPQVEQNAKKLLAYGVSADQIIPSFRMLGDIASTIGMENMPQLVRAFGQVKAAGRLMGTELRQFTETGIALIPELAKVTGYSVEEISQNTGDLHIPFSKVEEALKNMASEGGIAFKAMENQSATLGGKMSNFSDNIQIIQRAIGTGFLDAGKEVVEFFNVLLKGLNTPANMEHLTNSIKSFTQNAKKWIEDFGIFWKPVLENIKQAVSDAFNYIGKIFEDLGKSIKGTGIDTALEQLKVSFGSSTQIFVGVGIAVVALSVIFGALAVAIALVSSPLFLITAAITAAVLLWTGNIGGFRDKVELYVLDIRQKFELLGFAASLVAAAFGIAFNQMALSVISNVQNILAGLALIPGPMQDTFAYGAKKMQETMVELQGNMQQNLDTLANATSDGAELIRSHMDEKTKLMADQAQANTQRMRESVENELAQARDQIDLLTGDAQIKASENYARMAEDAVKKHKDIFLGTTEQLNLMRDTGARTVDEFRAKTIEQMTDLSQKVLKAGSAQKEGYAMELEGLRQKAGIILPELSSQVTSNMQEMAKNVKSSTGQAKVDSILALSSMSISAIRNSREMNMGVTVEAKGTATNVKTNLSGISTQASGWGNHLVSNYASGMMGAMGKLGSAVLAMKAKIMEVHQSYNPELPAQEWGEHLLTNFVNGMRKTQPQLFTQTEEVKNLIKQKFGSDGEVMKILEEFDKDKVMGQKFKEIYDAVIAEADKISEKFSSLQIDYQKLNEDAGVALDDLNKKHTDTINSIVTKIADLQAKIKDLNTSYSLDVQGVDTSLGEKVVDQQKLISDLEKQIEQEKNKKPATTKEGAPVAENTKLIELEERLAKEQLALEQFTQTAVGLEDEIAEAKRRNELTSFERFIEDATKKKEKLKLDFEEKKAQLQEEITVLEAQKVQETMIYEQKIAEYGKTQEAFRQMEETFKGGLDAMALHSEQKVKEIEAQLRRMQEAFARMKAMTGQSGAMVTTPPALTGAQVVPQFGNGGIVKEPTLAQIGEAGSEAVVPLPDGQRIPVQFTGDSQKPKVINFYFGDINITKEVDGENLIKKLTRAIELESLASF